MWYLAERLQACPLLQGGSRWTSESGTADCDNADASYIAPIEELDDESPIGASEAIVQRCGYGLMCWSGQPKSRYERTNIMNPKVDNYIRKAERWREELEALRAIVLDCHLTEELKWGVPCYTFQEHNVVLLHYFKNYCAILFPKGALLSDPEGVLIQQTANVQGGRQIRFTGVGEVAEMESIVKAYIHEAVEVEKAGLKVEYKTTEEFPMPEEFRSRLEEAPALKSAFDGLTPGRQRAYLLYFSSAKQSRTREARIEKYTPQILEGKGMHD